jgi:hypothetical protein
MRSANSDYLQHKESVILSALDLLRKKGYPCVLRNKQNGHIQVKSAHGIIYNFYPTTGTIVGFDWETVRGIDMLLQILKER